MDEKQQLGAVDDIQAALASMIAVEPSPEFAARVRQRIAAAAGAREWRSAFLAIPALGAAAVVALVVVLIFTGTRRVGVDRPIPSIATRHHEPAPVVSSAEATPMPAAVPPTELTAGVLVPSNEIVAVERLLSVAQAGRFEFELVPPGVPVAHELSTPGPISLPAIELLPIGASSSFE